MHSDYAIDGVGGWKLGYTSVSQSWSGFPRLAELLLIKDHSHDTSARQDIIKWYHRFSARDMPLPTQAYRAEVSFLLLHIKNVNVDFVAYLAGRLVTFLYKGGEHNGSHWDVSS